MITIYKYQLDTFTMYLGVQEMTVLMPVDAKILSVIEQDNIPCVCAQVDNSKQQFENRRFAVFGTGFPLDRLNGFMTFVGTIQIEWFVAHVFEVAR